MKNGIDITNYYYPEPQEASVHIKIVGEVEYVEKIRKRLNKALSGVYKDVLERPLVEVTYER